MIDVATTVATWAIHALSAYPPAATAMAVAGTVAGVVLLAQPLLRALVRWTPNKIDNIALEWLIRLANLLTPRKVQRGESAIANPSASDAKIVANIIAQWGDPANIPAAVLGTLTDEQERLLADAYVDAAQR